MGFKKWIINNMIFYSSEFGKNVTLEYFDGPNILFKCSGALYTIQINLYCEILHRFLNDDMWLQALKLCRHANVSLFLTFKILMYI